MHERHAVRRRPEPAPRRRHVIPHHEVQPLLAALPRRLRRRRARLGGEADTDERGGEGGPGESGIERLEDVGVAHELQRPRHLALLQLPRRAVRRTPVRHRRRHDEADGPAGRGGREDALDGGEQVAGGDDVHARDALGRFERDGAGDERHVMAGAARGTRDGEAHPPRRGIGEKAHGVEVFARRPRRHDEMDMLFHGRPFLFSSRAATQGGTRSAIGSPATRRRRISVEDSRVRG